MGEYPLDFRTSSGRMNDDFDSTNTELTYDGIRDHVAFEELDDISNNKNLQFLKKSDDSRRQGRVRNGTTDSNWQYQPILHNHFLRDTLSESLPRSIQGPDLVDHVAERLKEAEQLATGAERRGLELSAKVSNLRYILMDVKQSLRNDSRQHGYLEDTALEEIQSLRAEVDRKKRKLCTIKRALDISKRDCETAEQTQGKVSQSFDKERERLDALLSSEKTAFSRLNSQVEAMKIELRNEKIVTSRKVKESCVKLELEKQRVSDLAILSRQSKRQVSTLEEELVVAMRQKEELTALLLAARLATDEAKAELVETNVRLTRMEKLQRHNEIEKTRRAKRLSHLCSVLNSERIERGQLENTLDLAQKDRSELEQELSRFSKTKHQHEAQLDDLRNQVEDVRKIAKNATERLRESKVKLKHESQAEISRLEYKNGLLRMKVERAQSELSGTIQSQRAIKSQVHNAELELKRVRHISQQMSKQASAASTSHPKVVSAECEIQSLKHENEAINMRTEEIQREFHEKEIELFRLCDLTKELEIRLDMSLSETGDPKHGIE